MRMLLDECVPRPLRRELPEHTVRTVTEMGWSGKRNSELLSLLASHNLGILDRGPKLAISTQPDLGSE